MGSSIKVFFIFFVDFRVYQIFFIDEDEEDEELLVAGKLEGFNVFEIVWFFFLVWFDKEINYQFSR